MIETPHKARCVRKLAPKRHTATNTAENEHNVHVCSIRDIECNAWVCGMTSLLKFDIQNMFMLTCNVGEIDQFDR